jgi:hypothetical protein
MRKSFALGAVALLLSGCAIPVPLQMASWALDGISYVFTKKSITDHGISMVVEKDCALWRVMTEDEICSDSDQAITILAVFKGFEDPMYVSEGSDVTTALVSTSKYADTFTELAVTSEEIAELAEFDTAAGSVEEDAGAGDAQVVKRGDLASVVISEPTSEEVEVADQSHRGEPMSGIYFVIGSFRSHSKALHLMDRYEALLPTVLTASLDGGDIYRVVIGPAETGAEKQLHRDLSKAGVADTWAIRVVPGEWSVASSIIEARNTAAGAELLAGLPE